MKINIDSFDFILIVALIGGFCTGNWVPLVIFAALGFFSENYL